MKIVLLNVEILTLISKGGISGKYKQVHIKPSVVDKFKGFETKTYLCTQNGNTIQGLALVLVEKGYNIQKIKEIFYRMDRPIYVMSSYGEVDVFDLIMEGGVELLKSFADYKVTKDILPNEELILGRKK